MTVLCEDYAVSQHSIPPDQALKPTIRPIGIVAFDGVELLDLTGPMDAFGLTNFSLQRSGVVREPVYPIRVIAKKPGLVTASCGLRIHADSAYDEITEADDIDTLMIPGAPDVAYVLADPSLRDWVCAMSTRVRRLVSVCTGAFLLAEAGLLDGRRATTHWAYCERLAADYPTIAVEPDRIFCAMVRSPLRAASPPALIWR
jgi:transcriptional regulator GlxA family with amidase domain